MNKNILDSEKYIEEIIAVEYQRSYNDLVRHMEGLNDNVIITIEALMYLGNEDYSDFETAYEDMRERYQGKNREIAQMCGKGNEGDLFIELLRRGYMMAKNEVK